MSPPTWVCERNLELLPRQVGRVWNGIVWLTGQQGPELSEHQGLGPRSRGDDRHADRRARPASDVWAMLLITLAVATGGDSCCYDR